MSLVHTVSLHQESSESWVPQVRIPTDPPSAATALTSSQAGSLTLGLYLKACQGDTV